MKELLMGNEAVAVGALAAGVQVVSGYPGTPSTEALETIAKRNPGGVYVEWSVNEKAGAEVAAGASYAGARSMVTMKQMGLNVASDPVMCLSYVGVSGGMVIYVADDPGPISSQTEQDTRTFARYSRLPVLDANSPEEAFRLVQVAFDLSEEYRTPVILRATTRVCHSCAVIDVPEIHSPEPAPGFQKDPGWVIFPRLSYQRKQEITLREKKISGIFSASQANSVRGEGTVGIACGGISCSYVKDAILGHEENFRVLDVQAPYPEPKEKYSEFLRSVDKVFVFEELDPFIEDSLITVKGEELIGTPVLGKRTGTVPVAGELSAVTVAGILAEQTGLVPIPQITEAEHAPELPVRPPVLCAGCPHRGAFYAVKKAAEGRKAIFSGDIGCYTLGNAAPLDMVDTCLCMGAGITLAEGMGHADESTLNFAFIGDSTFFASGITGIVNAVYNQSELIVCILDNSTTAMTGHQPHPGIGRTMMGENVKPVDIEQVLRGIGVESVQTVDPLNFLKSLRAVRTAISESGVRAIIFKSPCIAIVPPRGQAFVNEEKCVGCMYCINEIGCPALSTDENGKVRVDGSLCTGCGLCAQLCPARAFRLEVSR